MITYANHRKLFDLVKDPTEQQDISKGHKIALAYTRAMTGLILGAPQRSSWWKSDLEATPTARASAEAAEIDEETRKQLAALGYVDGIEMDDIVEEDP